MDKLNEEIVREHAVSTLEQVENWLAKGDKEAAVDEIQEYGAAEFSHGFEGGKLFAKKYSAKRHIL